MALVLNTNSYVTVVQADTYFDTRIDSANWVAATDELKEQALVTATQLIDDSAWIGYAVSSSQALAWPRKGAVYYDPRMGQDITIAEDEVPEKVNIAVYEQALHLIDNEDLLNGTAQNYESISIGSISLTDSNGDTTRTPVRASIATRTLRPLLVRGSQGVGSGWWRAN